MIQTNQQQGEIHNCQIFPLNFFIFLIIILIGIVCFFGGYSKRERLSIRWASGFKNTGWFEIINIISFERNGILVSSVGSFRVWKRGSNQEIIILAIQASQATGCGKKLITQFHFFFFFLRLRRFVGFLSAVTKLGFRYNLKLDEKKKKRFGDDTQWQKYQT